MAKRKKVSKKILDAANNIDVVFVVDSTASMGPYIEEAKRHVVSVATKLAKKDGNNFRVGVVAYRDHPPQDNTFVTQVFDFMELNNLQVALNQVTANGGGDLPEAVWDGVSDACKLSWRDKSTRVIYLIGDCPPHGHTKGADGFQQGCPCGITDQQLIDTLVNAGIEVNGFSIANNAETTAAFKLLAEPTDGTVTIGDRPEQMTDSYASSLSAYSSITSDSSGVLLAMSATGSSYRAAAASLGWDDEKTKNIGAKLTKRALLSTEEVEDTTDTSANKEV